MNPKTQLFQLGFDAMRARFDQQAGMLEVRTDTGVFHPTRESLAFAYALVQAEGPGALPRAEAIIKRVLLSQERQEGNIHCGGFKWMDEDQGVTDLNAVQFALEQLLPFFIDYREQISDELRIELLNAFRLAAGELERLNVSVSYTNITLLDTLNTVLLAQVLDDTRLAERGRRRFDEWIACVNRSGAVLEYNSPTYAAVDLAALAELAERATDPQIAIKAQIMEERLWLHTAVHFHPGSMQLAGPHSRAYHNDVTGGLCGIKQLLYACIGDERLLRRSAYATQRQTPGNVKASRQTYHLPDYIERLLREKPAHYAVAETAEATLGLDLYTYMTPHYALGTASVGNNAQSNQVILYYRRSDDSCGVLFSRYIVNEKRFGSHYHATDRSTANNLNDEGQFWGLQHGSKSIALYGLLPQHTPVQSLKTEVFLLDSARLAEVWVDEQHITLPNEQAEPLHINPHAAVLIADGETYIALRPLAPENLGHSAPVLLQERDGELVLSMYNYYQGEPKRFWEYSSLSGPFYQRNIRAGFIVEVGDQAEYGDFAAFRAHILRGTIDDQLNGVLRQVRYATGADLLEITVDLKQNRLVERRINGLLYTPPMLSSPSARQSAGGEIEAGAAHLSCGPHSAWVLADDAHGCWIAASQVEETAPWSFVTPAGTISAAAFGFGKLVVREGTPVTIEIMAPHQPAPLKLVTGNAPSVSWNGQDISAECVPAREPGTFILPKGKR